jgi:protein TonB
LQPTTITEVPPDSKLLPAIDGTDDVPGPGGNEPGNGPPGPAGPGGNCTGDCGQGSGTPLLIGGDVKAPVGLFQPRPPYPESARRLHEQGIVILQAIVATDGSVENLAVAKGAFPLLDESALETVKTWKYRPATLNGRAVKVFLTVTVNFQLR